MGCEKTLHLELAGEAIAPALDPQHPRIRGRRSLAAQLTPGSGRGGHSGGFVKFFLSKGLERTQPRS